MTTNGTPEVHRAALAPVDQLKPHPQNYRHHPDDQRQHVRQSIREHGFYRNVIVARDGTILAGHGMVQAAIEEGIAHVPVVRLDIAADDPRALKILTGDNEIARLAEIDDRALAELLKEIREADVTGLLGTGYDDAMLANLVFVTRPQDEIPERDDAAAWVGMPEYEQNGRPSQLVISFDDDTERDRMLERLEITDVHNRQGRVWSIWYPPRDRVDRNSLSFEA